MRHRPLLFVTAFILALAGCQSPTGSASVQNPVATPTPTGPVIPAFVSPLVSTASVDFGPNVLVASPSTPGLQGTLDSLYASMESNQFGTQRHAVLLRPGTYNALHVNVGFYTQIAGLGLSPDDVVLDQQSTVQVTGEWFGQNSTCNFWRSAENFRIQNGGAFCFMWAVSQAAPLRRVHADHDLYLFEVGSNGAGEYASGGFLGDSLIEGKVYSGSQQQWLTRNTNLGEWPNGVWNMVFVGDSAPTASTFSTDLPYGLPFTVVSKTPVIQEKPFLYLDADGNYNVFVPGLRSDSTGPSWLSGPGTGTSINLNNFYVAHEGDTAAVINAQLLLGKNLLLTPGVYDLEAPIQVVRADTVVLGLGMASLRPMAGTRALTVANFGGVRIAGILFDSGPVASASLLEVGTTGTNLNQSGNPVTLSDVFFRVGGAGAGSTTAGLVVNSNDVILDHIWSWRADHGTGVGWTQNPAKNGVVVNGDRVTAYALMVEHFQEYQTLWNGNQGRTYFYQSELPYDPQAQSDWVSSWMGKSYDGWASYKVADTVTDHHAYGMGIYAVFIDTKGAVVNLDHAIEVPAVAGVKITDAMDLSIVGTGSIAHTINATGGNAAPGDFSTYPRVVDWPAGSGGSGGGATSTKLVVDQFNSSARWSAGTNSLGKPVTTQGGIYNLEGTTDLYFFYDLAQPQGFTETITQDISSFTSLTVVLKGGSGGEQSTLSLVLNDGSDHTVSLAAYGPITTSYGSVTVPLSAFSASLNNTKTLRLVGNGTGKTIRLQQIVLQ